MQKEDSGYVLDGVCMSTHVFMRFSLDGKGFQGFSCAKTMKMTCTNQHWGLGCAKKPVCFNITSF
jgi:hypothetical protein